MAKRRKEMYEFWYQVEYKNGEDGGEFHGSNAQECADYIRKEYIGYKDFKIISILRVETEWE